MLGLGLRVRVGWREISLAEQRNDRQRHDERHEHGDGQRDRQRVEELPFDAGQQAEREEDDDGRDRRRRDRPDQLLHGVPNRERAIGLQAPRGARCSR